MRIISYPEAMMSMTATPTTPIGELLRTWRQRRRLSQLELATEAEVSSRHLSFLETGRAQPSREMLLRLADRLEVPLRERNILLMTAGFAPAYSEGSLDDPDLAAARRAVDLVLTGHEPYPALAIDRSWNLVTANQAAGTLLSSLPPAMLAPPVNVLRLSLHPEGLAPNIVNFAQWRRHLLQRLRSQVELTADPALTALLAELSELPVPPNVTEPPGPLPNEPQVVVPFRLRSDFGVLSFFSTTTVFGTPVDVTLSELAIESFYPANQQTVDALAAMAAAPAPEAGPHL